MRQPTTMDRVTEDARSLLRAAQELHGERHGGQAFTPGTHLPLERAAERTGFRSNGWRYHDAIQELEYEGAIEWDLSARFARGDKHYAVTRRGLDDLGGVEGGENLEGQDKLFGG
ncbi:MAG: hypothetical protein ACRDTR_13810 [Rubrobacter sp.]